MLIRNETVTCRKRNAKSISLILALLFLVFANVYYLEFPTMLDTFAYLLGYENWSGSRQSFSAWFGGIKWAIPFSLLAIFPDSLDPLIGNAILTWVAFISILLFGFVIFDRIAWGRARSITAFVMVFVVTMSWQYRFFLAGFTQTLIYVWIMFFLYTSIRWQTQLVTITDRKLQALALFYVVFLAQVNDFWIFLAVFSLICFWIIRLKYSIRFYAILLVVSLAAAVVLHFVVKEMVRFVYLPPWVIRHLINTILHPFVWWPGWKFFESFFQLLWPGYYWWLLLSFSFFGLWFFPRRARFIFWGYMLALSVMLLAFPEAPSFNRYMTYFIPVCLVWLWWLFLYRKITQDALVLGLLFVLFSWFIFRWQHVNNSFLEWNNYWRYWLEYRLGSRYFCPLIWENQALTSFGSSFYLWYVAAGCSIQNTIDPLQIFYLNQSPIEHLLRKKPKFFVTSLLSTPRFDMDAYMGVYLTGSELVHSEPMQLPADALKIFGSYEWSNSRVKVYRLTYPRNDARYEKIQITSETEYQVTSDVKWIELYVAATSDSGIGKVDIGNMLLDLSQNLPYKEKDWAEMIYPYHGNVHKGTIIRWELNAGSKITAIGLIH